MEHSVKIGDRVFRSGTVTAINFIDGCEIATVMEEGGTESHWDTRNMPTHTVARCPQCDFIFPAKISTKMIDE